LMPERSAQGQPRARHIILGITGSLDRSVLHSGQGS